MTIDSKALHAALRPLGRTAEGVRKKLIAVGALGEPENASSCSIAVYLAAKFPDETVTVDANDITVNGARINTPEGTAAFIVAFDDGRYPELIKHRETCKNVRVNKLGYDDGYIEYEVVCDCERIAEPFGAKTEASAYARRARRAFAAAS